MHPTAPTSTWRIPCFSDSSQSSYLCLEVLPILSCLTIGIQLFIKPTEGTLSRWDKIAIHLHTAWSNVLQQESSLVKPKSLCYSGRLFSGLQFDLPTPSLPFPPLGRCPPPPITCHIFLVSSKLPQLILEPDVLRNVLQYHPGAAEFHLRALCPILFSGFLSDNHPVLTLLHGTYAIFSVRSYVYIIDW